MDGRTLVAIVVQEVGDEKMSGDARSTYTRSYPFCVEGAETSGSNLDACLSTEHNKITKENSHRYRSRVEAADCSTTHANALAAAAVARTSCFSESEVRFQRLSRL